VAPHYPEDPILSQVWLEKVVRVGRRSVKEIPMHDRKCSKCGSTNVYQNVGNNWLHDGVVIQTIGENRFNDLFQTNAFLCLDCRNLEIEVLGTTTTYGKQTSLAESIQASKNWIKA
jgi:hypothetical protein